MKNERTSSAKQWQRDQWDGEVGVNIHLAQDYCGVANEGDERLDVIIVDAEHSEGVDGGAHLGYLLDEYGDQPAPTRGNVAPA